MRIQSANSLVNKSDETKKKLKKKSTEGKGISRSPHLIFKHKTPSHSVLLLTPDLRIGRINMKPHKSEEAIMFNFSNHTALSQILDSKMISQLFGDNIHARNMVLTKICDVPVFSLPFAET